MTALRLHELWPAPRARGNPNIPDQGRLAMKISGVDIRPGNILEYERGIWKVAKIQHTQPGKGGAYMQVEMKNLQDGRKTNVRFRSADTVERVRLDTKDFQFLYHDGDTLVFMDKDNYEQINLPTDLIGEAAAFLQDGMDVTLELWDEKPISVALPDQVEATIVEADAVVKGQTASSSYKPALLDNGVRVMVPPHIESGTRIIVDVYERTYVGKAG
jgi:elongation factor P